MPNKEMQHELGRRIDQVLGRTAADLVIRNVTIANVLTAQAERGDIAITGGIIAGTYDACRGAVEIDGDGLIAVPGFIDAHVHVESAMITPDEFDRCVLPRGTTTAVCDPHEIANVLGVEGIRYFQESAEHLLMDLFVNLSSCVPATHLETSGAAIEADDLLALAGHPRTIGLSEFMNIGGLLGKSESVLAKLAAFANGHIDGHLSGISGSALNAAAACGIANCHESTTLAEAREKLRKGLQVLIRDGTISHDIMALHELITPRNAPFLAFCTDDRTPLEIVAEGHIDHIVRTAIRLGADPWDVYRVASWSAARIFGLDRSTPKWRKRGLIAPGWQADILLLRDFQTCDIHSVIKNGRVVTPELFATRRRVRPVGYASVKVREMTPEDFRVAGGEAGRECDVIGLLPDSLLTEHLRMVLPVRDGQILADPAKDVLKLAVIERHGRNGNIALGFVRGFGIGSGAMASSVGHDSHNITVAGTSDADMALAVNVIRANQGGYAVVRDGEVLGTFPLPVAGLLSDHSFESVSEELVRLREVTSLLESGLKDPIMMLPFLPLCVIPKLKLTDFGLVRFDPPQDHGPVLIDDQRGR